MSNLLIYISGFSISISVIISWIRLNKINQVFYPLLICLNIGLLNEFFGLFLTNSGFPISISINNNVYVLLESLLILWQFKNWGSFHNRKYLFWIFVFFFMGIWITENFIIGKITYTNSYFRVSYSFILVLLAINQINEIIVRDRENILLNPVFLICTGVIIYFTYKVLVEIFWIYGLPKSDEFRGNIYLIHDWINLFSNLIYAFAVLWMQKRQRFLLPS